MYESEGYQQYNYDAFPEWDETGELESVPGFGFLPIGVNRELNLMTQVKTNISTMYSVLPRTFNSLSQHSLINEVS